MILWKLLLTLSLSTQPHPVGHAYGWHQPHNPHHPQGTTCHQVYILEPGAIAAISYVICD